MRWTYQTGNEPLGETGDYNPYAYITNGEQEFFATKPYDIEDEELQEICDKLNSSPSPLKDEGWKKLFELLAEHGGEIVSTNDLSPDWIEQARASGRMWVDENSLGYVWEPNIKQFPTNDKEVEEFDRWYPLPVKLPKELEDPEIFFANMKKRELEEKQKKQN